MTKAELIKSLEPYDDDCEITVSAEPISEFYEIDHISKCRSMNRVFLYLDSEPFFDGYQLKEIIKYVLEYDSYHWSVEERETLERLVELWED